MDMIYLAAQSSYVDPYGDNIWARFTDKGLDTAVLGMVTVFAVLAILWGCLEVFKYVFYTLPEQRKKSESGEIEIAPAPAPVEEQEAYADDGEIVAAIIAAITAARAEEGATAPASFRVVSFRKRK